MAGQSQAANLGGMLSQIGNTLGTSVDSENYVRGTQNMFRPDVEADDIEGQRQLMNWQTKLGRTDEARNTLLGINTLEEKQKEENTRREGQARSAALNGLSNAIRKGNPTEIEEARDIVQKVGEVQGVSMLSAMQGIENGALQQQEHEWRAEDRLRQGKERADEETDKANLGKFSNDVNAAGSVEDIRTLLEAAPPEIAIQATQLADRAVQRIDADAVRAEKEREINAPVVATSAVIPEGLPKEVAAKYKARLERLNKDITAVNENPGETPKSTKQKLKDDRAALERDLNSVSDQLYLSEYSDQRAQDRLYQQKRSAVLSKTLPTATVEEFRNDASEGLAAFGGNKDITFTEAYEQLQQKMLSDLDREFGKDPAPAGFISAGLTQEDWNNSTSEERAIWQN